MTAMSTPVSDQLAELRAEVTRLQDEVQQRSRGWRPRLSPRRRARIAALVGIGAAVTAITGVAAATTGSTTNVSFVSLTTPFKLATNASIATGKTVSYAISGGTTTVPSNATTVRLNVSVKGTKDGDLNFYPAGNISGGSGQFLEWNAGGSASGVIMENVGLSNKLSVANSSAATATFTATITGYSTQVTAGDINGTGGSSGQVLTNNGSGGAVWQNASAGGAAGGVLTGSFPNPGLGAGVVGTANLAPGAVGTNAIADNGVTTGKISPTGGTAGQILTNTGTGTAWQTAGRGIASSFCCTKALTGSLQVVDQVTVPAGAYLLHVTAEYTGQNDDIGCLIMGNGKVVSNYTQAVSGSAAAFGFTAGPLAVEKLVQASATTTFQFDCYAFETASDSTQPSIYTEDMIATQVSSATGAVASP